MLLTFLKDCLLSMSYSVNLLMKNLINHNRNEYGVLQRYFCRTLKIMPATYNQNIALNNGINIAPFFILSYNMLNSKPTLTKVTAMIP